MPVYNGERFLKEAIESLINQSFTDWTMLISDDSSTDATEVIAKKFAEKDPRINFVKQPKNLGMNANFAYLLEQAHAPYFMWAAQDDVWYKDFIKECVAVLETEKKISTAFTEMINTDSYGRLIRTYPHLPKLSGKSNIKTVWKHLMSPEIMGKGNIMYGLIRTDLARRVNNLYSDKISWGGDVIFAFGLVVQGGVKVIPRVLYEKRHGGFSNSESTKDDDPKQARMLVFKNPKNHMFPIAKFKEFLKGHLTVAKGTSYKTLITICLYYRSLRALYIHLKTRNYKKFLTF